MKNKFTLAAVILINAVGLSYSTEHKITLEATDDVNQVKVTTCEMKIESKEEYKSGLLVIKEEMEVELNKILVSEEEKKLEIIEIQDVLDKLEALQ